MSDTEIPVVIQTVVYTNKFSPLWGSALCSDLTVLAVGRL